MTRTEVLLRDIDLFLDLAQMKPSRLGAEAIGDPSLYNDLKRGRRLWDETEQRVRDWMKEYARLRAAA